MCWNGPFKIGTIRIPNFKMFGIGMVFGYSELGIRAPTEISNGSRRAIRRAVSRILTNILFVLFRFFSEVSRISVLAAFSSERRTSWSNVETIEVPSTINRSRCSRYRCLCSTSQQLQEDRQPKQEFQKNSIQAKVITETAP